MKALRIACLLLVAACDDQSSTSIDPAKCSWQLAVASFPDRIVSEDLVVSGTIWGNAQNCAVDRVLVSGVAAKADSKNFATWSATVPIGTLRAQSAGQCDLEDGAAGTGGAGPDALTDGGTSSPLLREVALHVESSVAGGRVVARGCLSAVVSLRSTSAVLTDLTLAYPQGDYLPLSGSARAIVTVHATPESAGAGVRLNPDKRLTLTPALVPLGCVDAACTETTASFAVAGADLSADTTIAVNATSGGSSLAAALSFKGAPALFPAAASIPAGSTLGIGVGRPEGVLCTATLAVGFKVGGAVCSTKSCVVTVDPAVPVLLTAPANGMGTSTLRCADAYGQATTGIYDALAGEGGTGGSE